MNEIPAGIPLAAPWSLFAGAFGRDAIIASVVLFVLAGLAMVRPGRFERAATVAFVGGCVSLLASFGALALLFRQGPVPVRLCLGAFGNTTTTLPYKIAERVDRPAGFFPCSGVAPPPFSGCLR